MCFRSRMPRARFFRSRLPSRTWTFKSRLPTLESRLREVGGRRRVPSTQWRARCRAAPTVGPPASVLLDGDGLLQLGGVGIVVASSALVGVAAVVADAAPSGGVDPAAAASPSSSVVRSPALPLPPHALLLTPIFPPSRLHLPLCWRRRMGRKPQAAWSVKS